MECLPFLIHFSKAKIMKKILKFSGILFGIIVLLGVGTYLFFNESEPAGQTGQEADLLAEKMMLAVNKTSLGHHPYFTVDFCG